MEKMGYHKRDILSSRVEDARDSQKKTKEVFKSALEQFTTLVAYSGGDLQETYDRLSKQYDRSVGQRDELEDRIESVEAVAEALFREWRSEIKEYSNQRLKTISEDKYHATKEQYETLIKKMKVAEQSLDPVLTVFKDNVLFLKHNLNARAIGALRGELASFESRVAVLIQSMDKAIKESNDFIDGLAQE
jgi:exonuclease VII small subunit